MSIAHSKLTAQGQISVPSEVRKRLGVGPGSILEWDEHGGEVVVRKAGRYGCTDVYNALFPERSGKSKATAAKDVKAGIRKYIRKRHARD